MKLELQKLVELQKTDTNIRKLRIAIESAEARRAAIEQEFEQHASSIRDIQKNRDGIKAEHAELEKQIAENKTYLERANRNLKNSQNQKEYETAMRETDALQKQINTLEASALEKMTAIEEVEAVLTERADEINNLESNKDSALGEFDKELSKNKKEFDKASAKRLIVFDTLPPQLASVYNRLTQRSRDGIAVAEVVNGSCSACFMKLRPQRQVEVRRGNEIITCESCTRILYIAQEAQTAA